MYCIVPVKKIETRGKKNKTRDFIRQKYAAANFYNNGLIKAYCKKQKGLIPPIRNRGITF